MIFGTPESVSVEVQKRRAHGMKCRDAWRGSITVVCPTDQNYEDKVLTIQRGEVQVRACRRSPLRASSAPETHLRADGAMKIRDEWRVQAKKVDEQPAALCTA
eukprot:scaffold281197_cov33-Tisochrysis_lutea.AAC.1